MPPEILERLVKFYEKETEDTKIRMEEALNILNQEDQNTKENQGKYLKAEHEYIEAVSRFKSQRKSNTIATQISQARHDQKIYSCRYMPSEGQDGSLSFRLSGNGDIISIALTTFDQNDRVNTKQLGCTDIKFRSITPFPNQTSYEMTKLLLDEVWTI